MGLRNTARRIIAQLQNRSEPPTVTHAGGMIDGEKGGITSGGQAVLLPDYFAKNLTQEQLRAYLTEGSRQQYQHQFDTPYNKDVPFISPTEDPLKEWGYQTRVYVLSQTHAAYQRNPLANAAVEYTADFVIGKGFNLVCKNEQVEEILEAFIENEDNCLREYERQAVIDLQVDGELLLRYFQKNGEVVVVPQRPYELEWIETEPGFFRRRNMYHFQRELSEGDAPAAVVAYAENVPADEILHVAINRHAYELRGRPDLYRILPWLRADSEFLQNRARQNYWRGSLLWFVQVKNATSSIIGNILARWKAPTPGSIAVESDNVTVEPLANPVHAADASEDGRQIKLRSIIGMRMAEYMFADGQNANLASATAQQLPAITRFEAYQTIMTERLLYPMFKRVLQAAIDAGVIADQVEEQDKDGNPVQDVPDSEYPAQSPDPKTGAPPPLALQPNKLLPKQGATKMVDTLDAFEVSYSPISEMDMKSLAEAMQISVTNEWISNKTATEELGYDYEMEQKQIAREQVSMQAKMAQGVIPPPPDSIPPIQKDPNATNSTAT